MKFSIVNWFSPIGLNSQTILKIIFKNITVTGFGHDVQEISTKSKRPNTEGIKETEWKVLVYLSTEFEVDIVD